MYTILKPCFIFNVGINNYISGFSSGTYVDIYRIHSHFTKKPLVHLFWSGLILSMACLQCVLQHHQSCSEKLYLRNLRYRSVTDNVGIPWTILQKVPFGGTQSIGFCGVSIVIHQNLSGRDKMSEK